MPSTTNQNQVQEIINEIIKLKPLIIVIDGEDGVGKTTFVSKQITLAINAIVFSVDNYLDKDKGGYINFINYEKLKEEIDRTEKSKPIIIEGVMTLSVLEKLKINPDYFIYVCSNLWYDEWLGDDGYFSKNFEEIVSKTEKSANIIHKLINPTSEYILSDFRKEFFRYTYDKNPFKIAQKVLIMGE